MFMCMHAYQIEKQTNNTIPAISLAEEALFQIVHELVNF